MWFVANLRAETVDIFADEDAELPAYLLSSHRVTPRALEIAGDVRAKGLPLIADNGTKPMIEAVMAEFKADAQAISHRVREIRRSLGHVPRGQDVPDDLREDASALADTVVARTIEASEAVDTDALLEVQLSMDPTHLIAKEDFGTACLIGLDIERETTGWSVDRFRTRNRRSLRLWRRVVEDPRCSGIIVFAVLSAVDYNTGVAAGRLAAEAGATNIALGIAGITRDPSATDFFVIGTASRRLAVSAPRRYVRLAEAVRGIGDGYFAKAGQQISAFHCLGLGGTALLPIPNAALAHETNITTDATSPIHDAVRDRVLYDPEDDGARASIQSIVERILDGGHWPFLSPFTQSFRDTFGHDPAAARITWQDMGAPEIDSDLLQSDSGITRALPLFSEADDAIRKIASRTWIAHNHWVLAKLSAAFGNSEQRSLAVEALERFGANASLTISRGTMAALQVLAAPSPQSRQ